MRVGLFALLAAVGLGLVARGVGMGSFLIAASGVALLLFEYPPYVKNACVKCHKPHISQKKRVEKLREEG